MSAAASSVLYAVVLVAAIFSTGTRPNPPRARYVRTVLTAAAVLVVAVPSLVQLTVAPGLLPTLERDRGAIADGQVWRLVTSLVVQDGGWAGTVFNLVSLAVVGAVAERVWPWRRWLVVALSAGVGAQLWGLLVQPVGGGSSVVVFGLAASIAVRSLLGSHGIERRWAVVSLVGAAVLLAVGDLHGGAAAIGAAVGLLLGRRPSGWRARVR